MQVVSIHIYPIKGLAGISVIYSDVVERGLVHDRRYMLIDNEHNFISQRTHPKIALIRQEINEKELKLNYGKKNYNLPLNLETKEIVKAKLFENTVEGVTVSPEVDAWFSEILGEPIRLLKMTEQNVRYKKLIKGPEKTEVSFADGYPILIAGTASLEALNKKLDSAIKMNRFRPNIVIQTDIPHIEDTWTDFEIGDTSFMVIKPCARCQVITINQESGTSGKEPLKTLSSYRKVGNKIYFGANVIHRENGTIGIGDEVSPL